LEGLERKDFEFVHAEDADTLVIDGSHFSAEHVLFGDYFQRSFEGEIINIVDKELSAFEVKEVGAYREGLVEGRPVAIVPAIEAWIGRVLLFHSLIRMKMIYSFV
jgi:hypothetical protein